MCFLSRVTAGVRFGYPLETVVIITALYLKGYKYSQKVNFIAII